MIMNRAVLRINESEYDILKFNYKFQGIQMPKVAHMAIIMAVRYQFNLSPLIISGYFSK